MIGANSRGGLAAVERLIRGRINGPHANGVTIVDPNTTYVDVDVRVGADTVLHPLTFLAGATRIGAGATSARRPGSSTPASATGAR